MLTFFCYVIIIIGDIMNGKKTIVAIVIILLLCFIIFLGIFALFDRKLKNTKQVEIADNIIALQSKMDTNITTKGFTFDKPNIILNPYDISPLTAVIAFEKEEEKNVTITIAGKDENTTITHTFASEKNHILLIYGLYAGTDNKVTIEIDGVTNELTIKTDKLPDDFALPTNVVANKEKLGNELYFFTEA